MLSPLGARLRLNLPGSGLQFIGLSAQISRLPLDGLRPGSGFRSRGEGAGLLDLLSRLVVLSPARIRPRGGESLSRPIEQLGSPLRGTGVLGASDRGLRLSDLRAGERGTAGRAPDGERG
jgi:hypothetical protein